VAQPRTIHRCTACGSAAPRWAGRCSGCGEWNSLVEEADQPVSRHGRGGPARWPGSGGGGRPGGARPPQALVEIAPGEGEPLPTGVAELDRVLGGGLLPGSVTLLGGEPGIGKSTLVLQALAAVAQQGRRGLLVSAEESPTQVRRRSERLDALVPGLWMSAETTMPEIESAVRELSPDLVVVDSIQTVWDPDLDAPPGSVAQVRGCAHQLTGLAKAGGPATILVGHVTKEGALAGPRVLEHLVDTVLSFEGDRHHALRLLRSVKHRFGPTGELGLFEMTGRGLEGVADPGGLFLVDRRIGAPGSVVFPSIEGQRPMLVEIQALVVPSPMVSPRRSTTGFDGGRLALLLAVLDQRAGLSLSRHEVYVSAVGGVRVADPGADLAVCLALASAVTGAPVDDDLVVLGELGLAGEIRQVSQTPRRLAEAARLGFRRAVVPDRGPDAAAVDLYRVATLSDALARHLGTDALRSEPGVVTVSPPPTAPVSPVSPPLAPPVPPAAAPAPPPALSVSDLPALPDRVAAGVAEPSTLSRPGPGGNRGPA
jgi:DNA repair protein RadA/Sms